MIDPNQNASDEAEYHANLDHRTAEEAAEFWHTQYELKKKRIQKLEVEFETALEDKREETKELWNERRILLAGIEKRDKRIQELESKLEFEQENVRFYQNEWESACERDRYGQERIQELEAEVQRLAMSRQRNIEYRQSLKYVIDELKAEATKWREEVERLRGAIKDQRDHFMRTLINTKHVLVHDLDAFGAELERKDGDAQTPSGSKDAEIEGGSTLLPTGSKNRKKEEGR